MQGAVKKRYCCYGEIPDGTTSTSIIGFLVLKGGGAWIHGRRFPWRCNLLRSWEAGLSERMRVREGMEKGGARPAEGNAGERKPSAIKTGGRSAAGTQGIISEMQ